LCSDSERLALSQGSDRSAYDASRLGRACTGGLRPRRPDSTRSSLLAAEQSGHDVFVRLRTGAPGGDPFIVCREGGLDLAALIRVLRTRGCARVFVEGGGVTVSLFLEAKLLDRLHVAIAPLLIGDGRPAIRLRPPDTLGDCHRPRYRVFRMGTDVLFDCDLTAGEDQASQPEAEPPISRVI
jgi:riboflavin biosynthesis pyrimidine reductase